MTTHSLGLVIAWGFFVLATVSVVWAVSALKQAWRDRSGRTGWWWAIGGLMGAMAGLFIFLYVVWISDFFERWMYAVIVWIVVLAYLNAFVRWMRLGERNGRKP